MTNAEIETAARKLAETDGRTWPSLTSDERVAYADLARVAAEDSEEQLFRVTYTTSGLRRRTKTVTADDLAWLRSAGHTGIRVSSSRKATEAEAARGAFKGGRFNE